MKIRFQHVLVATLATFALLQGGILWRTHDLILRGYGDFASFYTAGKIVQQGERARLYDRGLQWQVQQKFASSVGIRKVPLPYIRPPFEALLFLPFSYLSYPVAVVVWTFTKVILLIVLPFLIPQKPWLGTRVLPPRLVQGVLMIGLLPVAFDLLQGQDSIPLLLVVAAAFALSRREAYFRSGACLGLGLFKFHLILPLFLVLLIRRRTRCVFGFMCMASVLVLLSIAVAGWSGVVRYPKYLWDLNQTPSLVGINGSVMPNIRGLLTPILGSGRVPLMLQVVLLIVSALGVVSMAAMWNGQADSRRDEAGFSYSIVVLLLTSYYTTSYDLTLLLLPLLLMGGVVANDSMIRGWPLATFTVSAGVLLLGPLYWVFAIPMGKFYWMALMLLGLAASLAGIVNMLRHQAAQPG